jgi:P27 family predicted phage terminase small subunit
MKDVDSLGRRRRKSQSACGWKKLPDKVKAAKAGPLVDRTPPKYLRKAGQEWWTWAVTMLDRFGILDQADVSAINLGAETVDDLATAMRDIKRHGALVTFKSGKSVRLLRNPAQTTAEKARTFLRFLYTDLGLTPSARAKFGPVGDVPKDPMEAIFAMPS